MGDVVSMYVFEFTNDTLGRRCANFTAGVNPGVVEDDQTFLVSLEQIQTPSVTTPPVVEFPFGASASVVVLERESQ